MFAAVSTWSRPVRFMPGIDVDEQRKARSLATAPRVPERFHQRGNLHPWKRGRNRQRTIHSRPDQRHRHDDIAESRWRTRSPVRAAWRTSPASLQAPPSGAWRTRPSPSSGEAASGLRRRRRVSGRRADSGGSRLGRSQVRASTTHAASAPRTTMDCANQSKGKNSLV